MNTYKIKFQFGKMPYYVWVDAANEEDAKVAAKRKVRGTYGTARQYTFLDIELVPGTKPLDKLIDEEKSGA